jgi:hypothetical protein
MRSGAIAVFRLYIREMRNMEMGHGAAVAQRWSAVDEPGRTGYLVACIYFLFELERLM